MKLYICRRCGKATGMSNRMCLNCEWKAKINKQRRQIASPYEAKVQMETLEELSARIIKDVPLNKHEAFLDWAISGQPIRTEAQKQAIIQRVKALVK